MPPRILTALLLCALSACHDAPPSHGASVDAGCTYTAFASIDIRTSETTGEDRPNGQPLRWSTTTYERGQRLGVSHIELGYDGSLLISRDSRYDATSDGQSSQTLDTYGYDSRGNEVEHTTRINAEIVSVISCGRALRPAGIR